MSAKGRTNRNGEDTLSKPADNYPTDRWAVLAGVPELMRRIGYVGPAIRADHGLRSPIILDPCCGEGNVLAALIDAGYPRECLYGIDIRGSAAQAARRRLFADMPHHVAQADYLTQPLDSIWTPPWGAERWADVLGATLTNPPYGGRSNLAFRFLVKALDDVRPDGTVGLLLRANWFADGRSMGRDVWLRKNTPDEQKFDQRPSFRPEGGADATTYGWYYWDKARPQRRGMWELMDCSTEAINAELAGVGLRPCLTDETRDDRQRSRGRGRRKPSALAAFDTDNTPRPEAR